MKSLKSPSSKKNKQKLAISQRRNLQMTIWKNNSFWSPNEKKNHKTIKEEWINGWNRRKKNHIDFIHHFITSKFFTLNPSSGCRKSENYLKRRSKTQEKSNKIHFEDSSRRAKYWRIQERWKKKKKTP
jgi:hypothetical protein